MKSLLVVMMMSFLCLQVTDKKQAVVDKAAKPRQVTKTWTEVEVFKKIIADPTYSRLLPRNFVFNEKASDVQSHIDSVINIIPDLYWALPESLYYVGVIPETGTTCDVTFTMDCEDNEGSSDIKGKWNTSQCIRSGNNLVLSFIRMDGRKFLPVKGQKYAVLRLGRFCPRGAVEFRRYFDNEDDESWNEGPAWWQKHCTQHPNATTHNGDIGPNTSSGNTELCFWLYSDSTGGETMDTFPTCYVGYGVFAPANFSKVLKEYNEKQEATIFSDDEDCDNSNNFSFPDKSRWEKILGPSFSQSHAETFVAPIISGGGNTTMNIAKVF